MPEKRKQPFSGLIFVAVVLVVGLVQPFKPPLMAHAMSTASSNSSSAALTNNGTFLTYQNLDFGIKIQYPSDWTNLDNLALHTIAAFSLIKHDPFTLSNTTLAEVDLRVYNAPQNESFARLNISQIYTQDQVVVAYYKNSTTKLGGFPALKIISYLFGGVTQKEMQIWTFIPNKHVLVEILYIAQPTKYSIYLPEVEKMIDSVEIAH